MTTTCIRLALAMTLAVAVAGSGRLMCASPPQ